jgi:hypothetical protein
MHEHQLEFFVALEAQVWEALVDGDPVADRALLTSDFLGVYTTGFASRSEHAGQLLAGPTLMSYSISDARLISVSESAVMLCYRADFRRPQDGPTSGRQTMYISSLWIERDGQWANSFSQDTPAVAPRAS